MLIAGDENLAQFRQQWTGEATLKLLREVCGVLLLSWEVGVGKSHNLDATIEAATKSGSHDLVVALLPRRELINERRYIKNPPSHLKIVNLRPRPASDCGPLDAEWCVYEKLQLTALGKTRICGVCPRSRDCFWPTQYGKSLAGARVIFGTQQHLANIPQFIERLQQWAKAKNTLVLLDEIDFAMVSFRRKIAQDYLERFAGTVDSLPVNHWGSLHRDWCYKSRLLLSAKTSDLRQDGWQMPFVAPEWSFAIQDFGVERHGYDFKFLGWDLRSFGFSPHPSRERERCGSVRFVARPSASTDTIIYSGTASSALIEHRLGLAVESPFADYRFTHPDTRWYNIASRTSMRMYFRKNSPQIIDFFAELIARRHRQGKRILLIAKKVFVPECGAQIQVRLRELGLPDVRVVTENWNTMDMADPNLIPLINFGVLGVNQFQAFDCAFCLTGYYVTDQIVNQILQDIYGSDVQLPIIVETNGSPLRRQARVEYRQHRFFNVAKLASLALQQQELDTVLQAVGRVRPYTTPCEVVTFQCSDHPSLAYTEEFTSLEEARQYFDLSTRRQRETRLQARRVQAAKKRGQTQAEAAASLGVGLRTVQRYWKDSPEPATSPI